MKKNPTYLLGNYIFFLDPGPVTVGDITGDFYQKMGYGYFHRPIETRCSFFFFSKTTGILIKSHGL